jgi:Lauroyl/myristoyl acyltransferase
MRIIKYFFQFLFIISLFSIFKIIGLRNASNLGAILGKFLGPLFRSKKIIKENIKNSLGNISQTQEEKIINGMWSNIGRTLAEYVFLKDFKFNRTNVNHMKINGTKYLIEIKKSNNPVIFYSGHFANFELMAMELDKFGIKTAAIYRPLNNFFLNPIMEYLRMKYICPTQIPKGRAGMREIISE